MELLCAEGEFLQRAFADPVFLKDDRVLQSLLNLEEFYLVPQRFMEQQEDIQPYMRKIVAQWMHEVCEEQCCEKEVFGLSLNLLDRFLACTMNVKRSRLQLVASACLFTASKIKETTARLTGNKLIVYTDYSITLQELLDWELLILTKLKWDISAVTPVDFVDLFLDRLNLPTETHVRVRDHCLAYITVCILEETSNLYPPSMIAAGCITAAIENLTSKWRADLYGRLLTDAANMDKEVLKSCQEHIERILGTKTPESPVKDGCSSLPGTPTEVLEIADTI